MPSPAFDLHAAQTKYQLALENERLVRAAHLDAIRDLSDRAAELRKAWLGVAGVPS